MMSHFYVAFFFEEICRINQDEYFWEGPGGTRSIP